jgi:hypothetical protein
MFPGTFIKEAPKTMTKEDRIKATIFYFLGLIVLCLAGCVGGYCCCKKYKTQKVDAGLVDLTKQKNDIEITPKPK